MGCNIENIWLCKPIVLICLYGFITFIKPSEPFLTPFLMGEHKNLTEEEVVNEVYPVWSYSYTAFLIPIFLLTDFLRYKPIIIVQGFAYVGCWVLLVVAQGVPLMRLMQVFYGLATACEIGYYSYIYSVVDPEKYQKSTSYVRTAAQLGHFVGSTMSQILVSVVEIDYLYLNVISLVNVSIGVLISLFLPYPKRSMYFNLVEEKPTEAQASKKDITADVQVEQTEVSTHTNTEMPPPTSDLSVIKKWKHVLFQLWRDLKHCYSTPQLLRWSIWWALSTCGWILVVNYVQNLWEDISPSAGHEYKVYNGAVEATARILGAVATFSVGFLPVNWRKWGEIFLGAGSLLEAGLLLLMVTTSEIWVCYIAYAIFIALYNFVITISQFQIAVGMSTERFALVFGMNTFIAVVLNSLLTLILIDDSGLGLEVSVQFLVYSGYFTVIAFVYLIHGVYALCKRR